MTACSEDDESHISLQCFLGIQQLDGIADLSALSTQSTEPNNNSNISNIVPHYWMASFALDRDKQLQRLREDAKEPNYTIEISPSQENINIFCNSAYYTKVVLPTFDNLISGNVFSQGKFKVTCDDHIERFDTTNVRTTTIIKFKFLFNSSKVGGVTVHLHHTTRNVQIQGSATLPDNYKAPLWFLHNFLS